MYWCQYFAHYGTLLPRIAYCTLFCGPKSDDHNATRFFMLGQNNRADKLGSIPKERGHSLTEETPQFICFHWLGSDQEWQTEPPASSTKHSPVLYRCPNFDDPTKSSQLP